MKILLCLSLVLALASVGHAQEQPPPEEPEYISPLRATWKDEVRKDPTLQEKKVAWCAGETPWRDEVRKDATLKADIEGALREAVHRDESATFTRNNKHVLIAYAAIWILTIGFVVFLWLRQGRLKEEIARLSRELGKAIKDDK